MANPGKVSWMVVDAWLAQPPCTLSTPYCHVQCPYYYECHSDETEGEDDEEWNDYYEQIR